MSPDIKKFPVGSKIIPGWELVDYRYKVKHEIRKDNINFSQGVSGTRGSGAGHLKGIRCERRYFKQESQPLGIGCMREMQR